MQLLQVAQHAEDLQRATDWYEGLLGRPPDATFDPPGFAFFVLGQSRLLLQRNAPPCLLYLEVGDLDSVVDRLRAEGNEIVSEPHTVFARSDATLGPARTDERMAFVRDSEGNMVGLVSRVPSDPAR